MNKVYVSEALDVLQEMDDVEFLHNKVTKEIKVSILMELGRLRKGDDIRELARLICDDAKTEKKTVHEWAALVRKVRLSKS